MVRERKSADQSNQPFGLLLIAVASGSSNAPLWAAAIEAVEAAKRETDVVGWLQDMTTLAVILPDLGDSHTIVAQEVEGRVRRELALRLDADGVLKVALNLHVHTARESARAMSRRVVDSMIEPLQPQHGGGLFYSQMKRGLDIVGSAALLLILSPLFLLIAALVSLTSPGPVFFRQVRVGQNAKPFTMLKFRRCM